MPKFSHTTTNSNHIAQNNALDDLLYWQEKYNSCNNQKQRDRLKLKVEIAEKTYNNILQQAKKI